MDCKFVKQIMMDVLDNIAKCPNCKSCKDLAAQCLSTIENEEADVKRRAEEESSPGLKKLAN